MLLIDRGDRLCPEYREEMVAAICLSFDYRGIAVASGEERCFAAGAAPLLPMGRDLEAERRARYLLESFGAVELDCIPFYQRPIGSHADYVIDSEGHPDAVCSFGAYAVPQLRKLGWRIEIDPEYPYQVVAAGAPWYAAARTARERDDWFSLELGVEIDGQRVNLLPALLNLLEGHAAGSGRPGSARFRYRALAVGERRYVAVAPERLRLVLDVLLDLYGGAKAAATATELRVPASRAPLLIDLERRVCDPRDAGLGLEAPLPLRSRANRLSGAGHGRSEAAVNPPAGLHARLREYQLCGLAWLQTLRACGAGGVLADDMGLGKTLQTIAHLVGEIEAGRADRPSLVVVPTSLVGSWRRELGRFAPGVRTVVLHGAGRQARWPQVRDCHLAITTYSVLVRELDRFEAQPYHLLIFDEAQALKNPRSRCHRAAKTLKARQSLCLTGTPVENNLEEMWALFHIAEPTLLGDVGDFRGRFRTPIERDADRHRLDRLRRCVQPYILRRVKEDVVPELPAKTELLRPVELTGAQRDLYESIRLAVHDRVRQAIARHGLAASTVTILDALLKLRQVCCDPRLVPVASARAVGQSAKYELLFELLGQQLERKRRVLVFSQFAAMLALIAAGLRERDIAHVALTGATADRQRPIRDFQGGGADVFLISLKAGGTGLNLTRADTVIHYDPWWNPAAQKQATDRAYRIGQTQPVFVYSLIVAGSVEERILRLQERKRDLADRILATRDPFADFAPAAIDGLFAPLSTPASP